VTSIADVKAAAERFNRDHSSMTDAEVSYYWHDSAPEDGRPQHINDAAILCDFALAVLSASGMTTEKLGVIRSYLGPETPISCAVANVRPEHGPFLVNCLSELLAEVLRLRAELESRK
jgi:hypothetical protein